MDEKIQKEMFFKLISIEKHSIAFKFSTQSKFKKIQNLTIEHLKLKKEENLKYEEIWIENLILKGYSIEIVNLNEDSFHQMMSMKFTKKIEMKFISDLILNDDYLHAFDYVSKKIFGVSEFLIDFSNSCLLVEKYFKNEKGFEKVSKKIQQLK